MLFVVYYFWFTVGISIRVVSWFHARLNGRAGRARKGAKNAKEGFEPVLISQL